METTPTTSRKVFYKAPTNTVTDVAILTVDGYRGLYSHMPQSVAEANDVVLMDANEASIKISMAHRAPPKRCTESRFMEMLEVLPPQNWQKVGSTESFKLQEHTAGDVTLIMVRVADEYFEMHDLYWLSHNEILAKVNRLFSSENILYREKLFDARRIVADLGSGERSYLIASRYLAEEIETDLESTDEAIQTGAQAVDETVYFYADEDVLWLDVAELVQHIRDAND